MAARRLPSVVAVGLAAALTSPSLAHGADTVSGQLIVGVKRDTSSARLEAIVEAAGGRLKRRLGRIDAGVARPAPGRKLSRLRELLADHPAVR